MNLNIKPTDHTIKLSPTVFDGEIVYNVIFIRYFNPGVYRKIHSRKNRRAGGQKVTQRSLRSLLLLLFYMHFIACAKQSQFRNRCRAIQCAYISPSARQTVLRHQIINKMVGQLDIWTPKEFTHFIYRNLSNHWILTFCSCKFTITNHLR